MYQLKMIFITVSIVTCLLIQAQGADKYTDENRPYEFGFTIDGEQHRHEKKDENGIIMGEYGFITADGVYHVTVYATDEFGHFKILSMKNIRVKPYPTGPSRQGHSLPFPPSQQVQSSQAQAPSSQAQTPSSQAQTPSSQAQAPSLAISPPHTQSSSPAIVPVQPSPVQDPHQFEPVKNEPPANSCSHCSLPTTSTRAPPPALAPVSFASSAPEYKNPSQLGALNEGSPQYSQVAQTPQSYPNQQSNPDQSSIGNQQNSSPQNYPRQNYQQSPTSPQSFPGQQNNLRENSDPIQQHYPQQYSPQNTGSPDSNSGQRNNVQDNNNYGQQNYLQTGYEPQSNAGPQSNQETVNNINSATNPQQASGSSQISPAQQNGLEQGRPQNIPQGFGSKSEFPLNGINAGNNYTPLQSKGGTSSNDESSVTPRESNQSQPNAIPEGASRTAKQYNLLDELSSFDPADSRSLQAGQSLPKKPILIAAQMQIVDKKTDIHYKQPGEQDGLPEGLTKDDMTNLLYTFNYTLGFHGHFEEGYTNGAKQGYYFVTGRNGVRTRVDYVADSKGFRPKITQEVLDLLSDEVPKPETEKDEKYGLNGYEFKWLYYPVETKAQ